MLRFSSYMKSGGKNATLWGSWISLVWCKQASVLYCPFTYLVVVLFSCVFFRCLDFVITIEVLIASKLVYRKILFKGSHFYIILFFKFLEYEGRNCPWLVSPIPVWNPKLAALLFPHSLALALQLYLSVPFLPEFQQRSAFSLSKRQNLKDIIKLWRVTPGRQLTTIQMLLAFPHWPVGQGKRKRRIKAIWVKIELLNNPRRIGRRDKENKTNDAKAIVHHLP